MLERRSAAELVGTILSGPKDISSSYLGTGQLIAALKSALSDPDCLVRAHITGGLRNAVIEEAAQATALFDGGFGETTLRNVIECSSHLASGMWSLQDCVELLTHSVGLLGDFIEFAPSATQAVNAAAAVILPVLFSTLCPPFVACPLVVENTMLCLNVLTEANPPIVEAIRSVEPWVWEQTAAEV